MPSTLPGKAVEHRGGSTKVPKDVALQVMVPARLKRAVSLRAANEGTTQRTIIMKALKAIGFAVSEDDLCDKRKVR